MSSLASDNYAGVHPAVLAAIESANVGHAPAYGNDQITTSAIDMFKDVLGAHIDVFMTFNGTGSNVVGLQGLLRSWEAVICASTAHINVDEAGAPEKHLGSKIIDIPTTDGKITPELLESVQWRLGDVHQSQPRVVLLTQSTEYGTVYSSDEIQSISDAAHRRGLYVYMDGARIANAAAGLKTTLRDITVDSGVDMMSFGGTKNGALAAEAVIVLNPHLGISEHLGFIRKQYMQLSSKMRFTSAQFIALLTDELWRVNAEQSNAMAQRLGEGVSRMPRVRVTQRVQANAVFASLPESAIAPLQAHTPFYLWDAAQSEVRWVCSWDTTSDEVDSFIEAVRTELAP